MRPTLLPPSSVNHTLPSGPAAMLMGSLRRVVVRNSLIAPEGVIRPILSPVYSVNQRFPSGPAAMPAGSR